MLINCVYLIMSCRVYMWYSCGEILLSVTCRAHFESCVRLNGQGLVEVSDFFFFYW